MKVIVLAAGQGTRLRPLTDNIPKCMVKYKNKPILEHQLDLFKSLGLKDLNIVCGYLLDEIPYEEFRKFKNERFDSTNMVHSLFCAQEVMDDDIIISYGDIIYSEEVLKKLLQSPHDISVVTDKDWFAYWSKRMENPLEDAESLKFDEEGSIKELGKKANSYDDIEGQYIGLICIKKEMLETVKEFYYNLDNSRSYDGNDFDNMYMTTFLQLLIDNNVAKLKPVEIESNWMEFDTIDDLNCDNFKES